MRTESDRPIAVEVADYIVGRHDLPDGLLDRARLHALDTIGAMIGATATDTGQKILTLVKTRGAPGRTTAVGLGTALRAEDSALANGTLAHTLEFDDGHRPSDNHLGCVVVPSALVMAEETGASWGRCLESIVIGYDVMGRAGEATLLPRNVSCFHGTGSTGVFGSAAVGAMMLNLDAEATAQALAIAGTAAAGLRESMNTGPECKPLHAGRATANGIEAAFLAQLGYTGPLTVFEGTFGFAKAMCELPRPEIMLDGLGERYSLLGGGVQSALHLRHAVQHPRRCGGLPQRVRVGPQDSRRHSHRRTVMVGRGSSVPERAPDDDGRSPLLDPVRGGRRPHRRRSLAETDDT